MASLSSAGRRIGSRSLGISLLVLLMLGTWTQALGQEPPQSDPGRAAKITALFQQAAAFRAGTRYDLAASALRDIAALAGGGPGPIDEAALLRASRETEEIRALVESEVASVLEDMEMTEGAIPRFGYRELREREDVFVKVDEMNDDPETFCLDIINDFRLLRSAIGYYETTFMRAEERAARKDALERALERIRHLTNDACTATDEGKARGAVADAASAAEPLEWAADEARAWLDLRPKKGQDIVIEGVGLKDLKRRIEARGKDLAPFAEAASKAKTQCEQARTMLAETRKRNERLEALSARIVALVAAFKLLGGDLTKDVAKSSDWLTHSERLLRYGRDLEKDQNWVGDPYWERKLSSIQRAGNILADCQQDLEKWEAAAPAWDDAAAADKEGSEEAQGLVRKADRCSRLAGLRAQQAQRSSSSRGTTGTAAGTPVSAGTAPQAPPMPQKAVAPAASGTTAGTSGPQKAPARPPASKPVPPVVKDVFGGIKIEGGNAEILVGQQVRFVATDMGNRPYPNTKVIWNSFDEESLSLNAAGVAKGLRSSASTITIQVKLEEDPSVRAYLDVRVVDAKPGTGTLSGLTTGQQTGTQGQTRGSSSQQATAGAQSQPAASGQTIGGFGDKGPPKVTTEKDPAEPGQETEPGETGDDQTETMTLLDQKAPPISDAPFDFKDKGTKTGEDEESNQDQEQPTVRPLTVQGAGGPAAWHIFATGSRMGWAASRSRYTDGHADQTIIDDLVMAGEHAMWANRESQPPDPAWPDWNQKKIRFRSWGEQLVRSRRGPFREQLALSVSSVADEMAGQLQGRTVAGTAQPATCEAAYMRLGFDMAFGQVCLQVAENARVNGRPEVVEKAIRDGLEHLRQAIGIMDQYEGRCVDLRDVRAELDSLVTGGDLPGQVRHADHAWETASDRIRGLAGGGPPKPEPKPSPEKPAKTEGSGSQPPKPTKTPPPPGLSGEIEGEWVLGATLWLLSPMENKAVREGRPCPKYDERLARNMKRVEENDRVDSYERVIFVKDGDRYVGRLAPGSALFYPDDPFAAQHVKYEPGVEIFRLVRTGPNTYEGEYLYCDVTLPGHEPDWGRSTVRVEGDLLYQEGPGHVLLFHPGSPRANRLTWIRRPGN